MGYRSAADKHASKIDLRLHDIKTGLQLKNDPYHRSIYNGVIASILQSSLCVDFSTGASSSSLQQGETARIYILAVARFCVCLGSNRCPGLSNAFFRTNLAGIVFSRTIYVCRTYVRANCTGVLRANLWISTGITKTLSNCWACELRNTARLGPDTDQRKTTLYFVEALTQSRP